VQVEGKKEFWALNLQTLEHAAPAKVRFDSIGKVRDEENLGKRLKVLLAADDRAGQMVRALTYQSLAYASERIPEIADTPSPLTMPCVGASVVRRDPSRPGIWSAWPRLPRP